MKIFESYVNKWYNIDIQKIRKGVLQNGLHNRSIGSFFVGEVLSASNTDLYIDWSMYSHRRHIYCN